MFISNYPGDFLSVTKNEYILKCDIIKFMKMNLFILKNILKNSIKKIMEKSAK